MNKTGQISEKQKQKKKNWLLYLCLIFKRRKGRNSLEFIYVTRGSTSVIDQAENQTRKVVGANTLSAIARRS